MTYADAFALTVNTEAELNKSSDKYRASGTNYDLPELFWADLSAVFSVLATSQGAAFFHQKGGYVPDQLEPFIKRLRLLVDSDTLVGQRSGLQLPQAA